MEIVGVPLWVAAIILFIFFSGYMALRTMKAESKLEQKFIEKEGQVFMERIEEARQQKEDDQEQRKEMVTS